jgi:ubiquinone/menaquinone biosynthesis C-methylase UbiE
VSEIIPLIRRFAGILDKDEVNLLDVGGGAGRILKEISSYIEVDCNVRVNKFALDLSPEMLEIQKQNNPDLKKALNEDIQKTSLNDKEVDVALMIDVLEHVPNPKKALEELKRISHFVIFKVPLDNNLFSWIANLISRGKTRKFMIETIGHINAYNVKGLIRQIEKNTGQILNSYFTDSHSYIMNAAYYKSKSDPRSRLGNLFAPYVFRLSQELSSLLFGDFFMMLVKCEK